MSFGKQAGCQAMSGCPITPSCPIGVAVNILTSREPGHNPPGAVVALRMACSEEYFGLGLS
jgi:hypothetical protein